MGDLQIDAVVIGASAAGLATSACLQRAGIEHLLLEREAHVAHAWRNHYERLHLHTPRGGSGLPGLRMPKSYPQYPSRAQVVEYLESYAAHFELKPRFGQEVSRVAREGSGWRVETAAEKFSCRHVVIASGYTHTPRIPSWPGQDQFGGEVMHSSNYRNGSSWKGRKVLVVGFGNSGGEIAIDLVEHGAEVGLAVRSPVNVIPRDMFGIPILTIGIAMSKLGRQLADFLSAPLIRAVVGDIRKAGLRKLPYGPFTQIVREGRIPLLDIGTMRLVREGKIEIHPGIERFHSKAVRFEGGSEAEFDAVVLATGYAPALERFLEPVRDATDEHGVPRASGHEALPGLFFCGYHVAPTGMLREISIEARRISNAIAAKRSQSSSSGS